MPSAAKRKAAEVEVAVPTPEVPPERIPLQRAIARFHKADAQLKQHDADTERIRASLSRELAAQVPPKKKKVPADWEDEFEDEWSDLEDPADKIRRDLAEKIAAADTADAKNAASLLELGKPPITGWRGDDARRKLQAFNEQENLKQKAVVLRNTQRADLVLARDIALDAVHLERDKLVVPSLGMAALARARDCRRQMFEMLAVARAILNDDRPRFPESAWKARHDSVRSRDAVVGQLRKELNDFTGGSNDAGSAQVAAETKAVLDRLLVDPLAEWPTLKE